MVVTAMPKCFKNSEGHSPIYSEFFGAAIFRASLEQTHIHSAIPVQLKIVGNTPEEKGTAPQISPRNICIYASLTCHAVCSCKYCKLSGEDLQ